MIAIPLGILWISAVFLALLDGRRRPVAAIALVALLASLLASIWNAFQIDQVETLVMSAGGWAGDLGISLRLDALGVIFSILVKLLLLIALFYEFLRGIQDRAFPALVLFLGAGLSGLFLTADAFNFYVFFEISMTSSFIIASYGLEPREVRDSFIFTVVNLLGSTFFLVAVAGLYHITGTLSMSAIAIWVRSAEPSSVILIATLIFVAFSLKLGLFPFHLWLPPVYRGVRPVSAAILSGVLANIGSYGLLRFGAGILNEEVAFSANALYLIAALSIFYGGILALFRQHPSEVLAYSSISQAGYILLGLAIGGPTGYAAAVIYSVVNAFNKTLLFLSAGLRGWLVGAAFVIGAFSVTGLPPAVGFLGKAALFRAGLNSPHPILLSTVIFIGSALSFIYMFQIYQRRFWAHGTLPVDEPSPLSLRLLVFSLALVVLAIGIWPERLLSVSERAGQVFFTLIP